MPSGVPYRKSAHRARGVESSPQIFPFGKSSRRENRNYSLRHGCAVPFRSKGEAKALFLIRAVKCRCKTLDGKRAGVLKYLQLNEESRCGGKSTALCPSERRPLAGRALGKGDGKVRPPRLRPGAMSAASPPLSGKMREKFLFRNKVGPCRKRLYTMV